MSLQKQIMEQLKTAMKAKDTVAYSKIFEQRFLVISKLMTNSQYWFSKIGTNVGLKVISLMVIWQKLWYLRRL